MGHRLYRIAASVQRVESRRDSLTKSDGRTTLSIAHTNDDQKKYLEAFEKLAKDLTK
jgi:hypothetical protein